MKDIKYKSAYKPGYLTIAGKKLLESNILGYNTYKATITKQYFKNTYGLDIDFGQEFFEELSDAEVGIAALKEGEQQKLIPTPTEKNKKGIISNDLCYLLSYDQAIINRLFPKTHDYKEYIIYEKIFSLTHSGVRYLHKITKGQTTFYDFSHINNKDKKVAIEETIIKIAEMPPQKFWFYDGAHSNLISHYDIGGKAYFFIFDSLKYSATTYMLDQVNGDTSTPSLSLMKTQIRVLTGLNKNVIISSENRQNSEDGCHFFVKEDLEVLEAYPKLHNEILSSSALSPNNRLFVFDKFPPILLKPTQSLSKLELERANSKIDGDITLQDFINSHSEEGIYGKRNCYIEKSCGSFLERCETLEFTESYFSTQVQDLIGDYLYY